MSKQNSEDSALDLVAGSASLEQIIDRVISRCEQSCRYVLKRADFTDASEGFRDGWTSATELCEAAMREHVASHLKQDIADLQNAQSQPRPTEHQ